jgi:phosphorylated adapter RNA export protein
MRYSDNSGDENDSVDSDSGNDSDSPGFTAKKPKIKKKNVPGQKATRETTKQNKYNIWCSELQETSLTEELVNCDVRHDMLDRSRDVESYDYKLAYAMDDQHDVDSFSSKSRAFPQGTKRRYGDRGSVKLRLGKRQSNRNETECRGSPRAVLDLNVTLENTNEEVASDIANKLCEEKDDLICKCSNTVFPELGLSLLTLQCWPRYPVQTCAILYIWCI